jgi:hypothetical protein
VREEYQPPSGLAVTPVVIADVRYDKGTFITSDTFNEVSFLQKDGYPGGSPNPIAQLAPCLELIVPGFGEINQPAATLLKNTYGSGAEAAYGRMSTYEKAVFLNTAAAAESVGVNLSGARFDSFLSSTKSATGNLPYGLYVTGASGVLRDRHMDNASVEIFTENGLSKIDVDLFRGTSNILSPLRGKHDEELAFNEKWQRPTHPGDVAYQLGKRNKPVNSGVSCK